MALTVSSLNEAQGRLDNVGRKLKLIQWMVGANIVLNFAILLKMLSVGQL